jgi:hypothetical protein
VFLRNPTTGIRGCCARAANGQTVAAPPERDEIAMFQLIELHSISASQGPIAGYRTDEDQSAGIATTVQPVSYGWGQASCALYQYAP